MCVHVCDVHVCDVHVCDVCVHVCDVCVHVCDVCVHVCDVHVCDVYVYALSKMIRCKVTSTKLTFLLISPSYALYNFSREHRITSAHMEKLDYFLGSQNQPSPCLNLEIRLATRRFTQNTSQSLLEQSGSHGNHVIF